MVCIYFKSCLISGRSTANANANRRYFAVQLGIAGSYAIWAVAESFPLFVLARACGGLSKANVSLSTAIMADISDAATRAKAMVFIFDFVK